MQKEEPKGSARIAGSAAAAAAEAAAAAAAPVNVCVYSEVLRKELQGELLRPWRAEAKLIKGQRQQLGARVWGFSPHREVQKKVRNHRKEFQQSETSNAVHATAAACACRERHLWERLNEAARRILKTSIE